MFTRGLDQVRARIILVFVAFGLGLMGCAAPTSVRVVDTPGIEQTLFDGRGINVSRKSDTVVSLSSITISEPNSTEIDIYIVARNINAQPFVLSTQSIAASVDGVRSKIFTYEELRAAEIRSRNIALIATAIGGAADAYSASLPQTTTGTFNSGGNFGTFSSTTSNPANSALASAAVTANTNSQINSISRDSEASLGRLQSTYLKPTTMNRGTEYGGVFRISVPRLKADSSQEISVQITMGRETHQFSLLRTWD